MKVTIEAEWSGKDPPPCLGDTVAITLNGWEGLTGKVVLYQIENCNDRRWLGVWLFVENRPDWLKKEFPNKNTHFFTGNEISLIKKYQAKIFAGPVAVKEQAQKWDGIAGTEHVYLAVDAIDDTDAFNKVAQKTGLVDFKLTVLE